MKKILLSLLAFVLLLVIGSFLYFQLSDCGISPYGCGDFSTKKEYTTQKIMVGSGPEDMATDTSLGFKRIIVSCSERRKNVEKTSGFYGINPTNNKPFKFSIEPANFEIYPHGIDIVTIDSIPYLYAISHNLKEGNWRHFVARFKIKENVLVLDKEQILENTLMSVPNDLDVLEDGSFYASNYVPNMGPNESAKAIIGIKTGSIVHYDGKGNWKIVLEDLCYPNGVYVDKNRKNLFIANGGCQEVIRYEIEDNNLNLGTKATTKKNGVKIPIGDNLLFDNQGMLWTVAHPCPLKFLNHAKDSKNKSPMAVFGIDPNTLKAGNFFQNNGDLISAASTVLRLDNRLYVSQVFDPFVLVIEGVEL